VIEILQARPGFTELTVNAERPSWLFAREPYYPGWQATIDGAPVEIHPAGGFLLALAVPAGRHAVRLEYREPGFARGAIAALIAMVALPLLLARQARRGRK
jgi:uncharacterized membrane protein YfhO